MSERFKTGDRIVINRGNPWHGCSGAVIDHDETGDPPMMLVELDNGPACYAERTDLRHATE